jgi:hypothetical protein
MEHELGVDRLYRLRRTPIPGAGKKTMPRAGRVRSGPAGSSRTRQGATCRTAHRIVPPLRKADRATPAVGGARIGENDEQ